MEWAYVRANLSRSPGAPALVRGKTYTLKISHTGGQKVNYFFDPRESTYAYGALARDQQVELQNDLVCRIYGVMNPVDSAYWGYVVKHIAAYTGNGWRARIAAGADTAGVGWNRLEVLWDCFQPNSAQELDLTAARPRIL